MARKPKKLETIKGGFSAMPHVVFDSAAYAGATPSAKALIFALIRQLNGSNNGHLQLASSWLASHGYKSRSTNISATKELIARGLVVQTRHGGLNNGSNLFAVTWLPISNFIELHIESADYKTGAWSRSNLPPTNRKKNDNLTPEIKKRLTAIRNCPVPLYETGSTPPVPLYETEKSLLSISPVPLYENNVLIPIPALKQSSAVKRQPIVGKAKHLRKVKHAS